MATATRGFQTPLLTAQRRTNTSLRTWIKKPDTGTSLTGFTDYDRESPDDCDILFIEECFPKIEPGKTVVVSIVLLGGRTHLGDVDANMIPSTLVIRSRT